MSEEKDTGNHVSTYAEGIVSEDAAVPAWLQYGYVFWIVIGFVCLFLYWNGSWGWLDRGYWQALQRAADTTYPFTTTEIVDRKK